MTGHAPEPAPDSPFWLLGDEDGGVGLMCRECDTGGAPLIRWESPSPSPDVIALAARRHTINVHPAEPEPEPCSVDYPVTRGQALGWAQQARWLLIGYYKFSFTFGSYCTVAYPDDPEAHEVEAHAIVSGDPGDFYRLQVGEEPLSWDELCYVRTPDLVIRENGRTLIEVPGDGG